MVTPLRLGNYDLRAGPGLRRERLKDSIHVDGRVPDREVSHPSVFAHPTPIAFYRCPRRSFPIRPAGTDEARRHISAGGEPLQVPFPRAGLGFIEIVDRKHHVALSRSEHAKVRHMHVAAGLDAQAGRRGLRQISGHHGGRPAQEGKGRGEHTRMPYRHQFLNA
jgi:hypothetical protein